MGPPGLCGTHLRNLLGASTSPGTLHTVLISIGTTSGAAASRPGLWRGSADVTPAQEAHLNPAPPSWGEAERLPAQGVPDVCGKTHGISTRLCLQACPHPGLALHRMFPKPPAHTYVVGNHPGAVLNQA